MDVSRKPQNHVTTDFKSVLKHKIVYLPFYNSNFSLVKNNIDENANHFLVQTLYVNRMSRKPLQNWTLLQLAGKTKKWKNTAILSDNYHFVPAGAYGPQGIKLIKQIAKKYKKLCREHRYLIFVFKCCDKSSVIFLIF